MTKLKLTEADIIRAIGDYLQVQRNLGKLMYIRNNTGAIPIEAGKYKRRYVRFGDKGSPDFLVFVGGIFGLLKTIAIECKSETGRMSEEQLNWQADFERLGGEYYVVRSIDRVMEILK
jgi:hypothetical protein